MSNNTFVIALGSNLVSNFGGSARTLVAALAQLGKFGLPLCALSRFYHSPAFPAGSGPDYVNACAILTSDMGPDAVLDLLHRVEARFGRERKTRWASRGIDLDLIAMGQTVLPDAQEQARWRALPIEEQMSRAPEQLILPHPRLQDRAFVLIPLAEIAPGWCHPATGASVIEMLAALPEAEKAALRPFVAPYEGD